MSNHGQRPNTTTYTQCQYTQLENGTTTQPCTNVAIMMPGYKRACAAHLIDVLLDSIETYLEVPRDTNTTEYLNSLITYLEDAP